MHQVWSDKIWVWQRPKECSDKNWCWELQIASCIHPRLYAFWALRRCRSKADLKYFERTKRLKVESKYIPDYDQLMMMIFLSEKCRPGCDPIGSNQIPIKGEVVITSLPLAVHPNTSAKHHTTFWYLWLTWSSWEQSKQIQESPQEPHKFITCYLVATCTSETWLVWASAMHGMNESIF